MQEHDGEYERDKAHAVCQKLRTHGHDNATDDQCKADNAYGGHVRLKFLESCTLAEEVVTGEADENRENRYVKDIEEHADSVYLDVLVSASQRTKSGVMSGARSVLAMVMLTE